MSNTNFLDMPGSISEDHGMAGIPNEALTIYSVGISTGGVAEIRMAEANPARRIVATSIDKTGLEFARKFIATQHLDARIEVRLEDMSRWLPYKDATFDFVYARLVLHYLPKSDLETALAELYRVLMPGRGMYVVVRSILCPDAIRSDAEFDPVSRLTTWTSTDKTTGQPRHQSRFFHTEQSISEFVEKAGFKVDYVKSYDEHLYSDFERAVKSPAPDNLVELMAVRP